MDLYSLTEFVNQLTGPIILIERIIASVKFLNERTESAYFWYDSVDWLNALMTC